MADPVKITVRIPAVLHAQIVDVAKADERSLNGEVIVLIREALARRKQSRS